jgi:hypothetical protein
MKGGGGGGGGWPQTSNTCSATAVSWAIKSTASIKWRDWKKGGEREEREEKGGGVKDYLIKLFSNSGFLRHEIDSIHEK